MDSFSNKSLYIPFVESSISDEFLMEYFKKYEIGIINRVDFIPKINKHGIYYHSAFLHFESWFQNPYTIFIQQRLKNKLKSTRLLYEKSKYWIIQENTSVGNTLLENENKVLGSGYVTGKKNQQINLEGLRGFKRV